MQLPINPAIVPVLRRAFPVLPLAATLWACSSTASISTILPGDSQHRDSDVAEVLLPVSRCGDYFAADVTLNGRGPFRFKLDTGFPRTQVAPHVAAALDVRRSVSEIDVGALQIRGRIPIDVTNLEAIGHAMGEPIDGILGYTVFTDLLVTWDFSDGQVRVSRGSLDPNAFGTVRMSRGIRPFIRATLGDRTLDVLLDTGYSGAIALFEFESLEFSELPEVVGARVRVDGASLTRAGRLREDLSFGAFTLRRPIVTDAVRRSLLGQDVLRRFTVTLDRAGGYARFVAEPDTFGDTIDSPPYLGTGLVMFPRAEFHEIIDVIDGTPADSLDLAAGDRVVAIGGVLLSDSGCRLADRDAPPARRLTIERDGRRFDVTITPAVLVK